jgi:GAF domain-containing protein
MSNVQDRTKAPTEEYIKHWRKTFAFPLLISVLIIGLFTFIPAFLATTNIATKIVYGATYLLVVSATIFPASYNMRIFAFLASVFAIGVNELVSYGILGDGLVFFYATVVIATLMLSPRAGRIATTLTMAAFAVTGYLTLNGITNPTNVLVRNAKLTDWLSASATIILFSAIVILGFQRLQAEIDEGQKQTEAALNKVEEERNALDERVKLRTADLDAIAKTSERRSKKFETISQVVKTISSIQELDTLLPRITQVVSEQFNIYHTGIFLLDAEREFAVLRAANSEGGQKMLARGHKLEVGQTGIVGFVTATGHVRIALDVGADAAYFNNPDLPNTHSEIALPLRYFDQIIGALDVQSTESNAFDQDDIEVLSTLADQIAITINNTLKFEKARISLAEAQSTFQEMTRESWKVMRPKSLGLGFQSAGSTIIPLEQPLEGDSVHEAIINNKTVLSNKDNAPSILTIPIRLRGQIVGVINLRTRKNRKLSTDETDIAEAVAERLSLAIETAALLQSTQHRADIERVTTDISSKIGASSRFETILQTAAQELSRALGGSDVLVQIEPSSIELGMEG